MTFAFLPVADELQLRNLVARYAYTADAGDGGAFADLFTDDGAWTRENAPPAALGGSGLPSQTLRGRDGLMAMIEQSIVARFDRKFRHQMTDVLLEPGEGPDEAKGLFRALITDWREGPGRIAMCGRYSATFRRTAAGWKFASVSVRVLPE